MVREERSTVCLHQDSASVPEKLATTTTLTGLPEEAALLVADSIVERSALASQPSGSVTESLMGSEMCIRDS